MKFFNVPALLITYAFALTAQTGSGSPPATFDYDTATLGVQGPVSPLLANPDYRSLRSYQMTVPVIVPINELRSALPSGFEPIPTAEGATTATLNLQMFVDQRFTIMKTGQTYGPVSAVIAATTVMNNNVTPARQELALPIFETSGEVDALNAAFGAGTARLAKVKVQVTEDDGILHLSFDIHEPGINFHLKAEGEAPMTLNTRSVSDPNPLPYRTFNGLTQNGSFHGSSQSDLLTLPAASAFARVVAPNHQLNLPTGTITILALGANVTFNRGLEFYIKFD